MISFNEIRAQALELGWNDVGTCAAKIPEEDIAAYRSWLEDGQHAALHYMENDLRCTPEKLLPGAKTAIIFITYYKQAVMPFQEGKGLVASYARGRDYHHLHRKRLKKFINWLENRSGEVGIAKGFSDSTPVLEKALAVQAGLGWFGKNTLLIHRKFGTFTLLSGVLTTLEMEPSVLSLDTANTRQMRCGTCTKCIDACPTNALSIPYRLDAARCLSYHLIESKEAIPEEIRQKNPGYAFGCDICQDVCPHNARKSTTAEAYFHPQADHSPYVDANTLQTLELQPEKLHGTPLQRRGVKGLRHNFNPNNAFP